MPASATDGPSRSRRSIRLAGALAVALPSTVLGVAGTAAAYTAELSIDTKYVANDDADHSGSVTAGDTLTFDVTLVNRGYGSATGANIYAGALSPNYKDCGTLAAGATCTLTGTHVVTAAEAQAGSVSVTGNGYAEKVTSVSDTETVPVASGPKPAKPGACSIEWNNTSIWIYSRTKDGFAPSYNVYRSSTPTSTDRTFVADTATLTPTTGTGWWATSPSYYPATMVWIKRYTYNNPAGANLELTGLTRYNTYLRSNDGKGNLSDEIKCGSGWLTPLALDLNGDNKISVTNATTRVDLTGDGKADTIKSWFGSTDGILVDTTVPGRVGGKHLFGDEGGKYADGFAKLATRDANGDQQVSGRELKGIKLWIDNGNAKVDQGELRPLAAYGVVSLSTTHRDLISSATRADGSSVYLEDVLFERAD